MKAIVSISAFIVSITGLIFLLSWHFDLFSLLQLPPSTWPIPYTAALCLFLSGLSLFTLHSSPRFPLPKILGVAIFFLGLQRTIELLFPDNLGLNRLFNSIHFYPSNSSRMVISAAIGFMLVGIWLLYWSKHNKSKINKITALFISVPIIFLGSIGIFIPLLPAEYESQTILIHFYTALGLFFIGLGFVIARFHTHPVKID